MNAMTAFPGRRGPRGGHVTKRGGNERPPTI
jgi:hypothetical protein